MTNNVNLSKSRRTRRNGDGTVYPIKNRNRWGASIHNYLGDRVSKSFETKKEFPPRKQSGSIKSSVRALIRK